MHKAEARTWMSHLLCVCVCVCVFVCKEPQLVFVGWSAGHRCKNHSECYNHTPEFFCNYSNIYIILKVAAGCVM